MASPSNHVEETFWSPELVSALNLICNCIGVNVVCIFGIIGNTINICILYRHGFKESSNIVLFSLSICDFLLVLTLIVGRLHCLVEQFDHTLAMSIQSSATVAVLTINRSLLFASIGHIAAISVERFVAIFFPFHVSRIFTPRITKKVVVFIYIINVLIPSPWYGAFYLGSSKVASSNKTVLYALPTGFYTKNEHTLAIYGAASNFITILFTLVLLTICCIASAIKLFLDTSKRTRLVGQDRSQKIITQNAKVSRMLLMLCLIFYLMFCPTTVLDLYLFITTPESLLLNDPRYISLQYISHLIYCINSSINFIIYVTMSRKYKATYLLMFGCRQLSKQSR